MFCASLLSRDAALRLLARRRSKLQRKKGGKPPLLEYKILKIGGRVAGSQPRNPEPFATLAFRRGHIRELRDKRLIRSRLSRRQQGRGMILKDYEVAPVSPMTLKRQAPTRRQRARSMKQLAGVICYNPAAARTPVTDGRDRPDFRTCTLILLRFYRAHGW